jgi:hypothetical protein
VKCADKLALLAKKEIALKNMTDRLNDIGNGMEINVEKTKIMGDQKQMEYTEYFNYVRSLVTSDVRCTREIKSRISMAKAAFNKKRLFSLASWT